MKEFEIDEKTLELFKHEIETHTRPIDEISKELELFEGVSFSVDEIITEVCTALGMRVQYLKKIYRDWKVDYDKEIDENKKSSILKYMNMAEDTISKIESLERYFYKDYEIVDIGDEV